ncbi:type II secretion system protein M [Yersinia ruckeri]|uniref:type II secretion system protein GspM n=1 Tax=Yersinia ruckeri TaxID=29486 RepID=UPI0020BECA9F|nr:type II secretion system protein GspM [Yersinia ruckeri]MCW6540683.1 type II secretion system protein M [Yersinia ruckeri]MCW6637018.1 type II secretion system protein M [Yersinia ruckeri]UZX64552.1 type II secretion system protein M [Yersinia ruckeri]UZY10786.1 type II secretion system protein M [Yersinia ruckeri]
MMTKIKLHWQTYSKREQWIFSLGGLVLLGLILIRGILAPLNHYQQQSELNLQQAKRDFATLLQQQERIVRLQAQHPLRSDVPADRAVHESARQQNLTIALQKAGANRAVLAPFTLPFPQLLSWLELLERKYGLQASQLKLALDAQNPNAVHITSLVLQRAEAAIL